MNTEIELRPRADITVRVYERDEVVIEQDVNKSEGTIKLIFIDLKDVNHTVKVYLKDKMLLLSQFELIPIKSVRV